MAKLDKNGNPVYYMTGYVQYVPPHKDSYPQDADGDYVDAPFQFWFYPLPKHDSEVDDIGIYCRDDFKNFDPELGTRAFEFRSQFPFNQDKWDWTHSDRHLEEGQTIGNGTLVRVKFTTFVTRPKKGAKGAKPPAGQTGWTRCALKHLAVLRLNPYQLPDSSGFDEEMFADLDDIAGLTAKATSDEARPWDD